MKCIAAWQGGINFLMQYAASENGKLFKRFQDKTRYGYKWGKWQSSGDIDTNNLPKTLTAGFGTAFRANSYTCVGWEKWRLPG